MLNTLKNQGINLGGANRRVTKTLAHSETFHSRETVTRRDTTYCMASLGISGCVI